MSVAQASESLPADLITVREAARLLPSCRPGRPVALSTIYRLIDRGQLSEWRVGRWRFVSRRDVLALVQHRPAPQAAVQADPGRRERMAWANAVLDAHGV